MTKAAKLSLAQMLALSATQLPLGALTLAVSVQMPRYFATSLGLSLTMVGAAFGLVRLIDIPVDPLLGLAMDRTRTRFGAYRLWTLAAAPILALGLHQLIHLPPRVGQAYLIGWLLVMYLGYSMLLLSGLAWAAGVATNYAQRSRLFGVFQALAVAGALAVLLIPVIAARRGVGDRQGVEAMIWAIIVAAPVCALMMCWRTPHPAARDHGPRRFTLRDYGALITRGNVLRLLGSDLCLTFGPTWMGAIYLFYFKDSRGFDTAQANLLLLIYIAAGFAGAPFTAWLAGRVGKHRALMVNTTVFSLMIAALAFLPRASFAAAVPILFLTGAMYGGFVVMTRALTGDIADEIRLETGREWMGLMYAMTNATTKVGGAVSIYLTFKTLAAVGYDPREGAQNTAYAIRGLELAFLIGPIIFVLLGGACFVGYKLSAARHAQIREHLEARDRLYDEGLAISAATARKALKPAPSRSG